MKKYLIPTVAAVALMSACSNEDNILGVDSSSPQGLNFTVLDFVQEEGSRTSITTNGQFTWAAGDTLGVFPLNGFQTAFPINEGAGTNTAQFDGADWALRGGAQYAAYFPLQHNFDLNKNNITVTYMGQSQAGNNTTYHLGKYDYIATPYTDVEANGNATFQFSHLGTLVRFSLVMPEADFYSKLIISTNSNKFMTVASYGLSNSVSSLSSVKSDTEVSMDLNGISTSAPNQSIILYMMMAPTDLSGGALTITVEGNKRYYTATISGKNMNAGAAYAYNATCESPTPTTSSDTHEYVDLGLPSGLLWATCNVGANAPEEYGDYFAWGDTEPYYAEGHSQDATSNDWREGKSNGYDWQSYKWCNNGEWTGLTKYTFPDDQTDGIWYWNGRFIGDNKTVLLPTDDAATVNWGEGWRMPTYDDLCELCNNCTWNWTTLNDVNGYEVVGPNGNSIFLPAAGYRNYRSLNSVGSYGNYWSSSLYGYQTHYSQYLYFYSLYFGTTDGDRYSGRSVRPVRSVPVSSIELSSSRKTLRVGGEKTIKATVLPASASGALCWTSSNYEVATVKDGTVTAISTGSCTITATATDGSGITATCEIKVVDNGYEYVDLGLPSGTLWATCNVGADAPEEYGDYFAWGETEPYYVKGYSEHDYLWESRFWKKGKINGYCWYSYTWCNNGEWTGLTKYTYPDNQGSGIWYSGSTFIGDNKTVLEPADDAATANWGIGWRMPTQDEMIELYNNCTWNWTTLNGVNGYYVVGLNGKSIFLPAAGYRSYQQFNSAEYGSNYYWTSSLCDSNSEYAYTLYFYSGNYSVWYTNARYYGLPVRPVCQ